MADHGEPEGDDFHIENILVGGATWGGKDKRSRPRPETGGNGGAPESAPTVEAGGTGMDAQPLEAEAAKENGISSANEADLSQPTSESAPPVEATPAGEMTKPETNFKWRSPEEGPKAAEPVEEGVRRGMLKRGGAGTSFVLAPEPKKIEKPKRKLFSRPERLKVEKPQGKEGPEPVPMEARLVRGKAAKFSRLKIPVQRHHLAVISGAGGTGKTTTALMLGWLLGDVRDGGVVVLESMPAGGALAHRLGIELDLSSADVFRIADYAHKLSDIQAVTQKFAKMEVVGTDNEPRLSDLLDPGEHERVLDLLLHYYPIVISDTETGLLAPRTTTTLEYADQIVFCITTDAGAAWQAAATLNWLLHQGGQAADLARRTVVVAHEMREGTLQDFDVAKEQIASRCRAIMTIPFDAQFANGGALDLAQLAESTYDAYLDLAVELAHEFGVITK